MLAPATPRTRHPLALRLQCRKQWVEGQGTLSEIAGKHNVPPQTVVAWYRRENWTAARNRWLEKQLSDNEAPPKPPAYAATPRNPTGDSRERKLQRLETQIEALDNFLDNAKTADEWHKLSTAKHRLLENYYILAGIPKPGSRRPARERTSTAPMAAVIVGVEPEPVPVGQEHGLPETPLAAEKPAPPAGPLTHPQADKPTVLPALPAREPATPIAAQQTPLSGAGMLGVHVTATDGRVVFLPGVVATAKRP